MAKGWKTAFTINGDSEVKSNDKHFNKTIRNTKTLTIDELKAESKEAFAKKCAQNDSILAAFEEKKLKSKTLIKRAIELKKAIEAEKDAEANEIIAEV